MAKNVSTMRSTIAPSTPQKIPSRRWRGDRLRQANAITTALSPESRMLTTMISTTAIQNCGVISSAISRSGQRSELASQDGLEQLAHLGGVARDLDPARLPYRHPLLRGPLPARDDRPGMAHALSPRRGDPGDEA